MDLHKRGTDKKTARTHLLHPWAIRKYNCLIPIPDTIITTLKWNLNETRIVQFSTHTEKRGAVLKQVMYLCLAVIILASASMASAAAAESPEDDISSLYPKATVKKIPVKKYAPASSASAGSSAHAGDAEAMKKRAEKGDAEAQYSYALSLLTQRRFTDTPSEEEPEEWLLKSATPSEEAPDEWLLKSAIQNYHPALTVLAESEYLDPEKRVEALRMAAVEGSPQAAMLLAKICADDRSFERNPVAGYVWMYLARHGFTEPVKEYEPSQHYGGSPEEMFDFYARTLSLEEVRRVEQVLAAWPNAAPPLPKPRLPDKRDVQQDHRVEYHFEQQKNLALKIAESEKESAPLPAGRVAGLQAAADKGDALARSELAGLYMIGKGVPENRERAFELIHQAADTGDRDARLTLARYYSNGLTSFPEEEAMARALDIYLELAETGDARALRELAFKRDSLYMLPHESREAYFEKILAVLEKAAEGGNTELYLPLVRYCDDSGTKKKHRARARYWAEKALSAGQLKALNILLGQAESDRDAKGLYRWFALMLPILPEEGRARSRAFMYQFSRDMTAKQVLELKTWIEQWHRNNPAFAASARASADALEAWFKGRDKDDLTPLLRAAYNNDTETLKKLAGKADLHSRDFEGHTPLHLAVESGSLEAAKLLLAAGAEVDARDDYLRTPLMRAAYKGNLNMARVLLKAGANPRLFNGRWETPLHYAVSAENPKMVALLLKAGAPAGIKALGGVAPLNMAISMRDVDVPIAAMLLDAGATPDTFDRDQCLPLHTAISSDNKELALLLLKHKANPSLRNRSQETPLHLAIRDPELTAALLRAGADSNVGNGRQQTPLLAAAEKGLTETVNILLNAKADPNILSRDGDSALGHAVRRENLELAKALLKGGADPNQGDSHNTALYFAVRDGSFEMVKALLDAKADPNLTKDVHDAYFNTLPLAAAAGLNQESPEIVKALLDAGADPDLKGGPEGNTALHEAAKRNRVAIVTLLLAAKANPNIENDYVKSALDLATDPEVRSLIEKAGGKSFRPEEETTALFDELNRPMNKAAEEMLKNPQKAVSVSFFSDRDAQEFSKTVAQEKAGRKSPYLTRAVLMDMSHEELLARIKNGAGVNEEDPVFGYPLEQALRQRRGEKMIDFLLQNGADPKLGEPLYQAIREKASVAVMEKILAGGADPNRDNPLERILQDQFPPEYVQALLNAGADPNRENPLCLAISRNAPAAVVGMLLKAGADHSAPCNEDQFPLDLAMRSKERNEITKLLLEAGAKFRKEKGKAEY